MFMETPKHLEDTDLLAILAKNQAEPENAISRFSLQRLRAVEKGGTSLRRGNRE
jgi:hypothetical protein